jgi:hypothetical protein
MTLCTLVGVYQFLGGAYCLHFQVRPWKRWCPAATIHGATKQKTTTGRMDVRPLTLHATLSTSPQTREFKPNIAG